MLPGVVLDHLNSALVHHLDCKLTVAELAEEVPVDNVPRFKSDSGIQTLLSIYTSNNLVMPLPNSTPSPSSTPVSDEVPTLGLKLCPKDGLGIVAAGDKQLRLCEREVAAPGEEEGCFLVPEHELGNVDEALESLWVEKEETHAQVSSKYLG